MERKDVKLGLRLRVVNDRWDASIGTLAQVESLGYVGTSQRTWYFRVRWLIPEPTRWGKISTNLFTEDLSDFELYKEPTH
jgi:hypothetical protein